MQSKVTIYIGLYCSEAQQISGFVSFVELFFMMRHTVCFTLIQIYPAKWPTPGNDALILICEIRGFLFFAPDCNLCAFAFNRFLSAYRIRE